MNLRIIICYTQKNKYEICIKYILTYAKGEREKTSINQSIGGEVIIFTSNTSNTTITL